ncbi:di-heme oxidoredictase family protein [Stigmatella sp. ncwal1]|uniref:Di-heme oxidoredictase family protein n=1 Tax=Stigmatella ashevillensis TaxID=2995309 RepID=A0ABT5D7A9_9BACT|nr:di-heme oxidoredictase family protein [Stigmatella ashevillena]MDC0709540.1 di-heme oxidoredictase family protein [Stigmatella ashevillena]
MTFKSPGAAIFILAAVLLANDSWAATYGVQPSGSSAIFYVDTTSWADLHYKVNNGGQLNVRMAVTQGRNQYTVTGLSSGNTVDYSFTYWDTACNCAQDTAWAQYKHGSAVDAGTPDAGTDAGTPDAGTDAGTPDAGTDAGTPDAGPPPGNIVPLFNSSTALEPALVENTSTALITKVGGRVRDRHARENQFQAYDHYLPLYFEKRTFYIEIVDEVAKGGSQIKVNLFTTAPHSGTNFRAFFRGINTEAEYFHNGTFTQTGTNQYTASVNYNAKESRAIRVGDRMEIEVGVFLTQPLEGRFNYYSRAWLYMVGQGGIVPFEAAGSLRDSFPMAEAGWSGGRTTLNAPYSDEPDNRFIQMALNMAPLNAQTFVEGRRIHHTDFGDGSHSEPGNPALTEHQNKLGPDYVARSCVACHVQNGRGLPPANTNTTLTNYVVKVGTANGGADAKIGSKLQSRRTSGTPESDVRISSWTASSGTFKDGTGYSLRKPVFGFLNYTPTNYSARITPQLVGMGLLEAVPETAISQLADPNDSNGDGISGKVQTVVDPETRVARLGRFGWKAGSARVKFQVAEAFNSDMGVTSTVYPTLDCGSQQTGCSGSSNELNAQSLDKITRYVALLGVPARRDLTNAQALQGETLFKSAGCDKCHTPTLTTSAYHPHTELRSQTIHPYTDLLLHDMGTGLADNLPEGQASGAEWRTPPLWGIGLTAGVSGGEAYLHDGRARSLSEAILWHGGEGEAAKQKFVNMTAAERNALLAFLKSL